MSESSILTQIPHSETDITSNNPIRFRVGDIDLDFALLSYRDFCKFDKGIKAFAIKSIVGEQEGEFNKSLEDVTEYDMTYHTVDPVIGLPYFLVGFCKQSHPNKAMDILQKWGQANPRWENADLQSPQGIRSALADYISDNMSIEDLYLLINKLIYLQSNIKKKAMEILQKPWEGEETKWVQPRSLNSRMAQASLLRKRSLKLVTRSSSQ